MNRSERFPSGQVARWLLVCAVSLGGVLLVAIGGVAAGVFTTLMLASSVAARARPSRTIGAGQNRLSRWSV